MSLSCDHLVGDLGNVGAPTGVVAALWCVLLEGWLVALADWQRVRVVEHVALGKARFSVIDIMDGDVRLGQPLSLNIDTLLWVVLTNHVFTHQVGDPAHLLLLEAAWVSARHAHCADVLEKGGALGRWWFVSVVRLSEVVSVLSLEATLLVLAVMVWK